MRSWLQKGARVELDDNKVQPGHPRGSRGTIFYVSAHMGGDAFIDWDDAHLRRCYIPQSCLRELSAVDKLGELV